MNNIYPQIIEKNIYFSYVERYLFNFDNDNAINYNVGPIEIELNIENKIIIIQTTEEWVELLKILKPILIEAWECNEKKLIKCSETEYIIYYNIKILEKYLDTVIILN